MISSGSAVGVPGIHNTLEPQLAAALADLISHAPLLANHARYTSRRDSRNPRNRPCKWPATPAGGGSPCETSIYPVKRESIIIAHQCLNQRPSPPTGIGSKRWTAACWSWMR
jgi:hypothetical protein